MFINIYNIFGIFLMSLEWKNQIHKFSQAHAFIIKQIHFGKEIQKSKYKLSAFLSTITYYATCIPEQID